MKKRGMIVSNSGFEPRDDSRKTTPVRTEHRGHPKTKAVTIIVILLILVAAAAITISQSRGGPLPTWDELAHMAGFTETTEVAHAHDLCVHFIDVGQGDGMLIQSPTGETLVIDAGERGNEQTMISYIEKYGDDTIEYVVATHPHTDHIGSMDDVLDAFQIENVIMPRLSKENTPTTSTYKTFLTAVKRSGAKVIAAKQGYTFSLGSGVCTILSPSVQSDDLNNMSVVLRLDWGDTSFLFTGDAETPVEKQLLSGAYASYLDVDVLKLGHHGSSTSSSKKFLNAVTPRYSIISCGVNNDYGHPHKETMEKLSNLDTTVLRTDVMGNIRIYSDGHTLTPECDYKGE